MDTEDLRVILAGAGAMGADHLRRLTERIDGARVSAVAEPDPAHRSSALAQAPGAAGYPGLAEALADGAGDAVLIAAPGPAHESLLLTALAAGLPILCEKPLTPDAAAAARVVAAEQAGGRRLIQVGFMRRFDPGYLAVRELVADGGAGELLMIHAAHRMASVAADYRESMMVTDSLVHELDVLPWLAGESLTSLEIRHSRPGLAPVQLLATLTDGTAVDVELNPFGPDGYQVRTEAIFTRRIVVVDAPPEPDYRKRFDAAYDAELRAWVAAARAGTVAGPSAWDGYRAAVACEAGVRALADDGPVPVPVVDVPEFYRSD